MASSSRRPAGEFAAPVALKLLKISRGAVVVVIVLALMLPIMAASLAFLLVFDKFLSRILLLPNPKS